MEIQQQHFLPPKYENDGEERSPLVASSSSSSGPAPRRKPPSFMSSSTSSSYNGADHDSIQALIDRIFDNDMSLTEINLDGQVLEPEDESALFEALGQNSRVTSLSLVGCRIANEGAAELMNALKTNTILMHINLEDNLITSNAATDFIAVLKEHNKTVQYLELKDNRVRSGLNKQISKLLEKRRPGYTSSGYPQVDATMMPIEEESSRLMESSSTLSTKGSKSAQGSRSTKGSKSKSSRGSSRRKII